MLSISYKAWTLYTASVFLGANFAQAELVFDDFSETTGLQLNGDAATIASGDGTVLRLTTTSSFQAGSVFTEDRLDVSTFTSTFSFRITNPGGRTNQANNEPGGDGMAFVVQNVGNTLGAAGGGIGYQGIDNSFAVEFDTWDNDTQYTEPSQSHTGILFNGSVDHFDPGQGPFANVGSTNLSAPDLAGPEFDDGDRWWAWVSYDGVELSLYLTQDESTTAPTLPVEPILRTAVNLQSTLGGVEAYVGFTSGTGNAWADHDVLAWSHSSVAIPEPAIGVVVISFVLLTSPRLRKHRLYRSA